MHYHILDSYNQSVSDAKLFTLIVKCSNDTISVTYPISILEEVQRDFAALFESGTVEVWDKHRQALHFINISNYVSHQIIFIA